MDLASLAERAVEDPDAMAELYRWLYPSTYNYIRYRCDDRELADELTSQVFMKLLEKIARYEVKKGPFKPWFFALTRNVVADYFRSERLRLRNLTRFLSGSQADSIPPEIGLIQDEWKGDLLQALSRLSQRERDLLGLKFAFELTYREMAEMVGLSESNVGVILYRALKRLREIMDETAVKKGAKNRSRDKVVEHG